MKEDDEQEYEGGFYAIRFIILFIIVCNSASISVFVKTEEDRFGIFRLEDTYVGMYTACLC